MLNRSFRAHGMAAPDARYAEAGVLKVTIAAFFTCEVATSSEAGRVRMSQAS
jgi:hypothetical protein